MIRRFIIPALELGVGMILIGSFLGPWLAVGDSLAVIRIPVAAAGVLFWFAPRFGVRRMLWVPIMSTLLLGYHGYDRTKGTGPDGPLRLYQKNMWGGNKTPQAIAQDILDQNPDFVTLQEVSDGNMRALSRLRAQYPHQHICRIHAVASLVVLSKHPIVSGTGQCSDWRAFAAVQVNTPHGPVWVISLHLFWPYPLWQSRQLDRILPQLAALKGPKVLGGDFNMLPGTPVEWAVTRAMDATALRPAGPTLYVRGLVPVSIDQILAHCGTVDRRPKLGSDHHGLVAQIGFDDATCAAM